MVLELLWRKGAGCSSRGAQPPAIDSDLTDAVDVTVRRRIGRSTIILPHGGRRTKGLSTWRGQLLSQVPGGSTCDDVYGARYAFLPASAAQRLRNWAADDVDYTT